MLRVVLATAATTALAFVAFSPPSTSARPPGTAIARAQAYLVENAGAMGLRAGGTRCVATDTPVNIPGNGPPVYSKAGCSRQIGPITGAPAPTATQEPSTGIAGDVDCSGGVNSVDALMVLREVAALAHSAQCIAAGDVDCNGNVNAVDALFILRHVAGLPGELDDDCRVQVIDVPPDGQIYHAAFPGDENESGEEDNVSPASLHAYEEAVGKPVAWVYFSHNWYKGRDFPAATTGWIRDAGRVPYVRLMLRSSDEQNVAEPVFTLARILDGEFDADLRAWARDARDFGFPLIVEYGTEVNGEWFSWNGAWNGGELTGGYGDPSLADGPERFRDAYRHIVGIMREEGAQNITWVLHVNNDDVPNEPWNRLEEYYPGDEWVDWIGVSVYGSLTPMDDEWPLFRDLMDTAYPRLAALDPDKPIVVLEFGAAAANPNGGQAEWADDALTDLTAFRWPRVIGFSWWNEGWENDDEPAHDTNMRVQDNPALADVFQSLVAGQDSVLGEPVLTQRSGP